ncbi:circumsporozoite protein [Drosophila albomicans]|uniref:Circumsporozoite protein n=1 Tax=Drosophila albomicans TaxID=7291 RepID=A0A6P8YPD7_DROAB|nr:circumsporozoite protein [Drosophila albomicans]
MNFSICMLILATVCLSATLTLAAPQQLSQRNEKQVQVQLPSEGVTIEEVILESNLHIKPKTNLNVRRVRSALEESLNGIYATHKRVKRQFFGNQPFGFNGGINAGTNAGAGGANSGVDVGVGPNGGNANANVQLNPFNQPGPNGYNQEQTASNGAASGQFNNGFGQGSSAAIGQAQGFLSQGGGNTFGAQSASTSTQSQFGNNNAASAGLSQVYRLPNGQTINFASSNNFANNGLNNAGSHGSSVSVSG